MSSGMTYAFVNDVSISEMLINLFTAIIGVKRWVQIKISWLDYYSSLAYWVLYPVNL